MKFKNLEFKLDSIFRVRRTAIASYSYLTFLVLYYLNRGLPDYLVFQRAVNDWRSSQNPYSWVGSELPFMHPPTGLLMFRLFDSLDFLVNGFAITCASVIALLLLARVINRLTGVSNIVIVCLLIFSTSLRVTIGNGQVGLIATLCFVTTLAKLLSPKMSRLDYLIIWISTFVLLSFKPYFVIGLIIASILSKRALALILPSLLWLSSNLLISPTLFFSWISVLLRRSNSIDDETNISTLTSISGRILNAPLLGSMIQALLFLVLLLVIYARRDSFGTQFCALSLITLVSSPYLHHQDYLLAIPVIFFLVNIAKKMQLGLIANFIFVGLQPNSLLAHLMALVAIAKSNMEIRLIGWLSLPALVISSSCAFLWNFGDTEEAYLLYDVSGQLFLYGLCYLLIQETKIKRTKSRILS